MADGIAYGQALPGRKRQGSKEYSMEEATGADGNNSRGFGAGGSGPQAGGARARGVSRGQKAKIRNSARFARNPVSASSLEGADQNPLWQDLLVRRARR